jgi:ABC-type multidrug transport system fused ATPase/permease subunit
MLLNRYLLELAGDVRWHILARSALGLAVTGTRVAQALLIAYAVASVFAGADVSELGSLAVALTATIVLRAALLWLSDVAAQWVANRTRLRLRERLYRRLIALGPGEVNQRRTGEIRAALVEGIESLQVYFGRYLPGLVQTLIAPVLIMAFLLSVDPVLTAIVAGAAAFAVIAPLLWFGAFEKGSDEVWGAIGELDAEFVDTIQGLPTVKAFNASRRRRAQLDAQAEHVRKLSMRQLHYALMHGGIQRMGTLGGFAAALVYAVFAYANGTLEAVSLLVVVFLVPEVFRPLDALASLIHDAFGAVSAADGISALLAQRPSAPPAVAVHDVDFLDPSVEFDSIEFGYAGRTQPALDDVSFTVAAGETVAVVGPSGSGKTTLVSLLLRFFDPDRGAVRIGGVDLRSLPADRLYGMVAVVSQDTYLFHGTIADNIALARPDATLDEIRSAAAAAGIDEFIAGLPDGYDTAVGERGLTLSGGQRQRVAIARALLKDAPILVLDEATSSVDAANEAAIQATLDSVSRDRTTLVIAHRLSTTRRANRVVVLDRGRVAEVGTHEALSNNGGVYAALTAAQQVMTG